MDTSASKESCLEPPADGDSKLVAAHVATTVVAMYPETQWTALAQASLHGDEAGRAALDSLCRNYWEPVRLFILSRGWPHDDSADLAQCFFVFLMEKGILHRAERERGRFRSFLQEVLNNFLLDERARRATQKRGGGIPHEEADENSAVSEGTAAQDFDRQWALAVMRRAYELVAAECLATRGEEALAQIGPHIGGPGEMQPQDASAAKLGMSHGAFRSEIFQWRGKLREALRAEVRRTVSAPHEVEDEMDYLRQLLTTS